MDQVITARDAREAQRSDAVTAKKPGLAVVMATKRAISKLRKPAEAAGKSTNPGGPTNGGTNVGSSVGKKMVLAMEVILSGMVHLRIFCIEFSCSVDVEL